MRNKLILESEMDFVGGWISFHFEDSRIVRITEEYIISYYATLPLEIFKNENSCLDRDLNPSYYFYVVNCYPIQ